MGVPPYKMGFGMVYNPKNGVIPHINGVKIDIYPI